VSGPFVVAGAAGGCGASLVAGALALCWAALGARPWLVELDLDRGDLAGAWGLPADRTIADLAVVAAEIDAGHLRAAAFPHRSGVSLLPGPGIPGAEATWDNAGAVRLVDAAAAEGRTIVDAGAGLGRLGLAVAERSAGVLIVCPPTLAGARRARRLLDVLAVRGVGGRAAIVVSEGPERGEIGARALGRALAANVVGELPWARAEGAELSAGRWAAGRRRPLHRAVERLAEAIA
jgi:MinD-like ATPase involved in chromosome partitioning or flagellar assembly